MGILQDKKVAVALALIVMILGTVIYFVMDIPGNSMDKEKGSVAEIVGPQKNPVNNTGMIPIINNEEVV